jgi:hypothetical protein
MKMKKFVKKAPGQSPILEDRKFKTHADVPFLIELQKHFSDIKQTIQSAKEGNLECGLPRGNELNFADGKADFHFMMNQLEDMYFKVVALEDKFIMNFPIHKKFYEVKRLK